MLHNVRRPAAYKPSSSSGSLRRGQKQTVTKFQSSHFARVWTESRGRSVNLQHPGDTSSTCPFALPSILVLPAWALEAGREPRPRFPQQRWRPRALCPQSTPSPAIGLLGNAAGFPGSKPRPGESGHGAHFPPPRFCDSCRGSHGSRVSADLLPRRQRHLEAASPGRRRRPGSRGGGAVAPGVRPPGIGAPRVVRAVRPRLLGLRRGARGWWRGQHRGLR